MYLTRIRLANFSKSCNCWHLMLLMFVTGVSTNLNPFEIMLTWLSVSWRLEKFLMKFSLFCLLVAIHLIAKFVLHSLHLLFALHPFIFSTPLPAV